MNTLRLSRMTLALSAALALFGCGQKEEPKAAAPAPAPTAAAPAALTAAVLPASSRQQKKNPQTQRLNLYIMNPP